MCCLNFFQINMHFVKRSSLLPLPVGDNSCSSVLRINIIYTKTEAKKAGFGFIPNPAKYHREIEYD